ncbi:MAG: PH domain-containing protein, partial [Acidobacteria bacterium]|nr:PH domain-containing protein [Acidobacteriota bacterium]
MSPETTIFTGRLHPLTLVFGVWQGVRGIWPLLLLGAFGNRWWGIIIMGTLSLAGSVAFAAFRYFSFSYRIENNELITKEGLLGRSERHIPLARVQEIRIEQHLLHRLFNVVDAQIETASGQGAEATLSVLSRAEAERLRQAIFNRGAQAATNATPAVAPPEAVLVRRLSLRELAIAGLTSNHLVSALVIVGAIWQFTDDVLPRALRLRLRSLVEETVTGLLTQGVAASLWLGVAGLIALLLIGMVFSMVGSVVLFYGFTLTRQGDDLQRRYGLFTRRSSNLPRRRIQVLKIEESFIRRWFGFAAISADVSGNQREGHSNRQGRDVLLPLVRRDEYEKLLPLFLPELGGSRSVWKPVSPRAIR